MSNRKGFTLIELLIVVVIIGILAAIAIPKFANTKEKAYVASMKSDLRNLITAQEAYFSDNNSNYAASIAAMGTNYRASSGVAGRPRCAAAVITRPVLQSGSKRVAKPGSRSAWWSMITRQPVASSTRRRLSTPRCTAPRTPRSFNGCWPSRPSASTAR